MARSRRSAIFAYNNRIASREALQLGAGDVSDARMEKAVEQIAEVFELKSKPKPAEIFSRAFLPPRAERNLPAPKG